MRMIDTSLFVLITGILGFSMVLAYNPHEKGLLQSMLELNSALGSANSNTLNREAESVVSLLKESCMKNSGSDAYDTAKKGWQVFLNCSKTAQLGKIEKAQFADEEKALIYFKKYCAMASSEKDCVKQLSDSIKPCMEPEERRSSHKPIHLTNLLLQFICNGDGDGFEQFVAHGGQKCLDLNKKPLLDCSKEFSRHYSATTKKSSSVMHPNANDCINVEKYQLCFVEVLNQCVDHTPADIVDTWFDSMTTEMGCKDFFTSQASLSSIIDVVLITILMAILTRF